MYRKSSNRCTDQEIIKLLINLIMNLISLYLVYRKIKILGSKKLHYGWL